MKITLYYHNRSGEWLVHKEGCSCRKGYLYEWVGDYENEDEAQKVWEQRNEQGTRFALCTQGAI